MLDKDGAARQVESRRPQRKFMAVVKKDMQRVHVTGKEAGDRVRWRQMIAVAISKRTS